MKSVIQTPLYIPELDLKPVPTGGLELSEDIQQALALIAGFWRNKRVLLKASQAGILFVASPQITDIFHVTATTGDFLYQGESLECTDVLVMGHPDNAGLIWVRPHTQAEVTNSWPLLKKESIDVTLSNLTQLHLRIVTQGDIAIIVYTL